MTFQNTYYKELDGTFNPLLKDLYVTASSQSAQPLEGGSHPALRHSASLQLHRPLQDCQCVGLGVGSQLDALGR